MRTAFATVALVSFAGASASIACGGPAAESSSAEDTGSTEGALTFSPSLPSHLGLSPTPSPTATFVGNIPLPPTSSCGDVGESCCAKTFPDKFGFPHPISVCNPGNECKNEHCFKIPPPPPCGGIGQACCDIGVDCRPVSESQASACRSDSYGEPGKCVMCGHLWQSGCNYTGNDPKRGCSEGIGDQFGQCVPAAVNLPVPPAHDVATAESGYAARARAFLQHEACNNNDLRYPGSGSDPDPEHWGTTALAMAAFDGTCRVQYSDETQGERLAIIDKALANFDTHGRGLGSTLDQLGRKGELDAWLKDLVPLLYLYGSRLSPETYDKILTQFGQIDSGPYTEDFNAFHFKNSFEMSVLEATIPVPLLPVLDNVIEVEVPETENHLLLIHSARYLINQLLLRRIGSDPIALAVNALHGGGVDNHKNGMRDHLLSEMQRILQHDFQEYNSRPYSRYSLDAVENLAEFAEDPEVATAARAVLDFEAAKYAISSSFSRRSAPYRRRRENDSPLLTTEMDEEACRFALYAGTTDLLQNPPSASFPVTVPESCHLVARQAAGSYRVPQVILQMALEPGLRPTFQTFAGGTNPFHNAPGGLEITANDHHFMISSGGEALASGLGLTIHLRIGSNPFIPTTDGGDLGIAVPTVLIPTMLYPAGDPRNGVDRNQMVHLGGDQQINTCVAPGFACGFQPVVPDSLCTNPTVAHGSTCQDGRWSFLDFQGFYAAIWRDDTNSAGFFEAVEASRFASFEQFKSNVKQANGNGVAQLSGNILDVNYVSSLGKRIVAHLDPSAWRTYPIQSYDGQQLPSANVDAWPLARVYGGWAGLDSRNHDGVVTIGGVGLGQCTLDLSDAQHPQRIGNCD